MVDVGFSWFVNMTKVRNLHLLYIIGANPTKQAGFHDKNRDSIITLPVGEKLFHVM